MRVTFRPAVIGDVAEIQRFIARDNPARGETFAEELVRRSRALGRRPRLGRRRPEFEDDEFEEVRSIPYKNYVIFYDVGPDRIRVLRIVHGARDLEKLKF